MGLVGRNEKGGIGCGATPLYHPFMCLSPNDKNFVFTCLQCQMWGKLGIELEYIMRCAPKSFVTQCQPIPFKCNRGKLSERY